MYAIRGEVSYDCCSYTGNGSGETAAAAAAAAAAG